MQDNATPRLKDVHPHDNSFVEGYEFHFNWVGESFRRIVIAARAVQSTSSLSSQPKRIMDFGCGFGRITRIMRKMFPDAEIVATDTVADKGQWCAEHFGAVPWVNSVDLDKLDLPEGKYDLIWLGSVVTHLSEAYTMRLLGILSGRLTPGGLLIVSTHGRNFYDRFRNEIEFNTSDKTWGLNNLELVELLRQLAAYGFGFVPYSHTAEYGPDYGFSIVTQAWWASFIQRLKTVRLHYLEGAWDQHHDVAILQNEPAVRQWRRDIVDAPDVDSNLG